MKKQNLLGKKFGRWIVIDEASKHKTKTMWNCVCECGNQNAVMTGALMQGKSRSCGCLVGELARIRSKTHGRSKESGYDSWRSMKQRCLNKNHGNYKYYGGSGITICKEWIDSFERFIKDMGERPSKKHQLDRIDSNDNYKPNNCHWVTSTENNRNLKKSKWWFINGTRYESSYHAAIELNTNSSTIQNWCKKGKNGCYSEKKYA